MMKSLGIQYIGEFYGCDRVILASLPRVERIMLESARLAKANVVKTMFHGFSPHGISGVILIAESHFTVHTWPEHGYAAVDLFCCGSLEHKAALDHIHNEFNAQRSSCRLMERGRNSDVHRPARKNDD